LQLRQAMTRMKPRKVPLAGWFSHAAVAAVVREAPSGAELLFIRRAEHPADPWSGHMAFPGGRVDRGDSDVLATAMRETREEIALDLGAAPLLGKLSQVPTRAHGKLRPMVISPFVFELNQTPALTLSDEVQEVIWVPVDYFRDRKNRTTMSWKRLKLPCYRLEPHSGRTSSGRVIWGLTLQMLDELLAAL
jgi:8-oxo-dGTP pyrophosphatase MutT (NUDIX family)